MEKVKENSKKIIYLVIILIVIILAIVFFLNSGFLTNKEKKLDSSLKELGSTFYTEIIYKQLEEEKSKEDLEKFLKGFETNGIKINLDNLERNVTNINKEKLKDFNDDGKKCDKEQTKVIIYPKAPYGKDDFTIQTQLECGFDKK